MAPRIRTRATIGQALLSYNTFWPKYLTSDRASQLRKFSLPKIFVVYLSHRIVHLVERKFALKNQSSAEIWGAMQNSPTVACCCC